MSQAPGAPKVILDSNTDFRIFFGSAGVCRIAPNTVDSFPCRCHLAYFRRVHETGEMLNKSPKMPVSYTVLMEVEK